MGFEMTSNSRDTSPLRMKIDFIYHSVIGKVM